jgi:DNA-binding transcriptional MerR regulator
MLLKSKEVALLLKCTQRNIGHLVDSGKLTPIYKDTRFMLFKESDVLEYIVDSNRLRYEC